MLIAWTTLPTKELADTLAADAVQAQLAVCVQVESPVTSHYVWAGRQEKAEEYRLTFKVLPALLPGLETWVHARHPYQVPEWIVVKPEQVGEKYLSWARAVRNN